MITASALFSLLLGGMASSVLLARRCAYEGAANSPSAGAASSAYFWMSQDIGEAISVEVATENRLAITVPDRNGDGAAETIDFAWIDASSTLERKLNAAAPEILVEGLSDFRFTYITRNQTVASAFLFGPEQRLMQFDSSSNLANTEVDSAKHKGQYIEPALAVGAVSWIPTMARLRMRSRGATDGEATIQLRSAVGRLPGGEILGEVKLQERVLSSSYTWTEVQFKPAPEPIAAGVGICLVVKGAGPGDACELQFQNKNSLADGTDFVQSTDGGARWSAPPEKDLLFELHGRVGTLTSDVTESYLQRVVYAAETADPASVVRGSATALNEPKLGN